MLNLEARIRAEQFVSLHMRYTILPPDDQGLPPEMVQSRYHNVLDSGDEEFEEGLEDVLVDAPVSAYFIGQILEDAREAKALGMDNADEVKRRLRLMYEIDLDEDMYGIFHPEEGPRVEFSYVYDNFDRLKDKQAKDRDGKRIGYAVTVFDWEEFLYNGYSDE